MLLKIAFAASAGWYSRAAHGPGIALTAGLSGSGNCTAYNRQKARTGRLAALTPARSVVRLIQSILDVRNIALIALMRLSGLWTGPHPVPGIRHTKTPIIRIKTQSERMSGRQTRNLSGLKNGLIGKSDGIAKNHKSVSE